MDIFLKTSGIKEYFISTKIAEPVFLTVRYADVSAVI